MTSASFYGLTLMGLFGVVTLEVILLRLLRGRPIPWQEVAVNMNSGQLMLWTIRGIRVLAYAFVAQHASLRLLDGLGGPATIVATFLMWDLCFYTSHWAHHRIPFLWKVHAVHHQGSEFNISLAVRNAWLQVLTPTPFFLLLAVIGVPLEIYLSVGAAHYIVQLYNHNGVILSSGWLDHFLVTPTHHRVHHAQNLSYRDRNFGSSLIIWDRLFGTFAAETPDEPVEIGLHDAPKTQNILWLNLEPFLHWVGIRSPDFAIPKVRYDYGGFYLFAGSLLHFMLMACYIIGIEDWSWGQTLSMWGLIFVGTVLLGGVADGRRRDLLGWIALSTAGSAAYLITFPDQDALSLSLLCAVVLHGLWAIPRLLRAAPAQPPEAAAA